MFCLYLLSPKPNSPVSNLIFQLCSFSGDGVYKHCDVTAKIEEKLGGRRLFFLWDPMHKAALADVELRSGKKPHSKEFGWLVEMTTVIGKAADLVAWGKGWKTFFDICQELQENPDEVFKMKRPARFSETKHADHAHDVYDKARNDFKPFIIVCEEAKEEGRQGSSDQKKRAAKAEEVQGKMFNWMFALSLSMVTDLYKVYRSMILLLQTIDMLPQDKHDGFKGFLSKLLSMAQHLKWESCSCAALAVTDKESRGVLDKECFWPRLHHDIRVAEELGTYQGVSMGMVREEASRSRAGARLNMEWLDVDMKAVVRKVEARAVALIEFLEPRLREKVYSASDVANIENCRRLLDLKSQVQKVSLHGYSSISSLQFKTFLEAAVHFEPELLERLDEEDLRVQFRKFNRILEEEIPVAAELDSHAIVKLLLDPEKGLFKGIEGVVSILANATICLGGVESVCESMVSVMEAHTTSVTLSYKLNILDFHLAKDMHKFSFLALNS